MKKPSLRDLKYWGIGALVSEIGQLAIIGGTSDKEAILQSLALPLGIMGAGLIFYIERRRAWRRYEQYQSQIDVNGD